jgi:hypothetical protein
VPPVLEPVAFRALRRQRQRPVHRSA